MEGGREGNETGKETRYYEWIVLQIFLLPFAFLSCLIEGFVIFIKIIMVLPYYLIHYSGGKVIYSWVYSTGVSPNGSGREDCYPNLWKSKFFIGKNEFIALVIFVPVAFIVGRLENDSNLIEKLFIHCLRSCLCVS